MKKVVVLMIIVLISACGTKDRVGELFGLYDGHGYTAPFGAFTVNCRDWLKLSSLQDRKRKKGAAYRLMFNDKDGNRFRITASFVEGNVDEEKIIDKLVEDAKKEKKMVIKTTTPDAHPCMLQIGQLKAKDADKGYGRMLLVFYKNGVLFETDIKTHPVDTAKRAAELSDECMSLLWQHVFFRGYSEVEKKMKHTDPRFAATVNAAMQAASQLGSPYKLAEGPEPVVLMFPKKDISLGLRIIDDKFKLTTKEALVYKKQTRLDALAFQAAFYKQFYDIMLIEKLTVYRNKQPDKQLAESMTIK